MKDCGIEHRKAFAECNNNDRQTWVGAFGFPKTNTAVARDGQHIGAHTVPLYLRTARDVGQSFLLFDGAPCIRTPCAYEGNRRASGAYGSN